MHLIADQHLVAAVSRVHVCRVGRGDLDDAAQGIVIRRVPLAGRIDRAGQRTGAIGIRDALDPAEFIEFGVGDGPIVTAFVSGLAPSPAQAVIARGSLEVAAAMLYREW